MRDLATLLAQVAIVLLTVWSIGALAGLLVVGFRMVAG